jgi:Domain of unknown function (DUF4345)
MALRRLFQAFLVVFGVIAIGISLAHLAAGPEAIIGGSAVNPTSDGEDRFYAGLFGCYGVALLWCVRGVERKQVCVNVLAGALLVGGIGRLIALIVVGPPNPFFVAMLVLELVLPPVMVLAAHRVTAQSVSAQIGDRVADPLRRRAERGDIRTGP